MAKRKFAIPANPLLSAHAAYDSRFEKHVLLWSFAFNAVESFLKVYWFSSDII
jgi:hypothetical protein